ncbi:GGDEF domain-containing protein [Micromonospora sp. WMMD1082]|uniref:GGDEF domain-containing protein n=1 Tax=Micromonospora sp. WMMD1082 TaxID=3016104 RepID=UPI0024164E74|nr:GGDEF domain-containing protein [Micromonospora sp. WMMD1082]MDG4793666.1 GGDEF domain-containing protein [Micromonospora sp. WMMD1082]
MSILAALAATAALGFILGRLSNRPEFRKLRSENTHLRELVDNLDVQLRLATYMAGHDRLTGLPNRSSAAKVFLIREMQGLPTLVALIDLDRFKHTNDTYGHHVGDDLLRAIAERLAQAVKPHGGTAARLAGDEFLLLLPADDHTDQAKPVAAILDLLAEPATLSTDDGDIVVHPEASAGIAVYDGNYGTFDTMLHHADVALYHAKQQRGTHRTYEPHMRMPRNASRHGPRRRDQRPADNEAR